MFDGTLRKALAVDLEQSPFLNVVPDQKVQQTLKFMGRSPDERITTEIGREICQRDGIKAMLSGSIARLGNAYVVTLTALNASNGDTLAEAQQQASSKEQVLSSLDKAVTSVREKLGESLASVQKFDKPLDEATTSSLEALKAYNLGEEQHELRGNDAASIPFYQRAIELDPNFALAYARLATVFGNLGESDKADQFRQKAFDLRNRTSERERLYIESHYYTDGGQEDKGVAAYELYAQTYPRDSIPLTNLGVEYGVRGDWEKSQTYSSRSIENDPDNYFGAAALARAYQAQGRFEEAKAVLNTAMKRNLGGSGAHTQLSDIALAQGDAATQQREEALARKDPFENMALIWNHDAFSAMQRGQMKRASQFAQQSVEIEKRAKLDEIAASALAVLARILGEFGLKAPAASGANAALATSSGMNPTFDAAAALALAGDEKKAQALIGALVKKRPDDQWVQVVYGPWINTIVALNHNDASKALTLLNASTAYRPSFPTLDLTYTRGRAYLMAGQPKEAAQQFQSIIAIRGVVAAAPELTLAQVGLARAYAAMGEKDKARSAYQDLLALWKDADPGVPLIEQVKAEYGKLR